MGTGDHSRLSEPAADGFGLLPVEIRPGFLKKLLGDAGFIITPEDLRIIGGTGEERHGFLEIASLRACGSAVALELAGAGPGSGKAIRLETGDAVEAGRVATLLERLTREARRHVEILDLSVGIASLGRMIDECLGFRGRPYVAAAETLLRHAARAKVTDVHLEPLPEAVRVTVRAARELVEAGSYRHAGHEGLCSRLKYLAGCHSHRTGITQEGAFSMPEDALEIRLSVYPAVDGERVALRFIRPIAFPDLPSLGWPSESVAAWRRLLAEGPGLVLIVGPIGSGKTTALYATLAELAGRDASGLRRVATLEDPVEGRVPGICQSSLTAEHGNHLDVAFKHLLRQDPDVMALGEIRDAACLREALQAGQAGHLVLATFHAADAAGAFERLRRLGLEGGLVATSLRGILAVRLDKGMKPSASLWLPEQGGA